MSSYQWNYCSKFVLVIIAFAANAAMAGGQPSPIDPGPGQSPCSGLEGGCPPGGEKPPGGGGGGGGGACVMAIIPADPPGPLDPTDQLAGKLGSIPGKSMAASLGSSAGVQLILEGAGLRLNGRYSIGPYARSAVNGAGNTVFLGTGASHVKATDFTLALNGLDWLHIRTYTSLASHGETWQGESWWGNEMMFIDVDGAETGERTVTVTMSPHFQLDFYIPEFPAVPSDAKDNYPYTLWFESGSDEYILKRVDGMTWVFHDANATDAEKLKRIEDAYGNDWAFTYTSSPDQLTDIVVDVVEGEDHKIVYEYFTSGDNDGKLQYIKVYKTETTSAANLIGKVEYVYHDDTEDDYGITGDLIKVIVSKKATNDGDGVLSIEDVYRYRYYKGAYNASTNPGVDHSLRYVLYPENGQRMTDDEGTPESQDNTTWDDYANVIYEYDSDDRVRETQERIPGSGCGCGGGGATTTYTWATNGGSPGIGAWNIHGIADRADDTRVIFDYDKRFNLLTWVVQDEDDGTPTKELVWHFDYGTNPVQKATWNRMTAAYNPSACSAYDESAPYDVTVNSSSGVVHTFEYFGGLTDYRGYLQKVRIKEGSSGTAQTLTEYGRSYSERPDLATSITHYESTGEADGRTTSLSYTFYDGDKLQIKQIETTYPSISSGKNGPGASAVEKQFFDKRTGALRWTLDGEGYVNFYAYDDETGVQDLAVIDANTSTLMTVIDDNWNGVTHGGLADDDTLPFSRTGTGTALDLDSSSTIDWLGRTRKTTDAGGMITYYVYKEDELRVYPAWDTSTEKTLIPIRITQTDEDGRVEGAITLDTSFDPNVTSNEPNGTATANQTDYSTWAVTEYSNSGTRTLIRRYHSVPSSGIGTRYSNYYQDEFEYDSMGRLEYTIQDVADESDYDREQVSRYYYDFVGRKIKLAEGVSDNTHDVSAGKPTLNTAVEYFFDDPDSDATPEQGEGDGNLHWVRTWHGTGGSDEWHCRCIWAVMASWFLLERALSAL